MLNRRFIVIIIVLLINLFLLPEGSYTIKIISFLAIAYILFENYHKAKDDGFDFQTEIKPITQKLSPEIDSFLSLVQNIMNFNGASYFSYDQEDDVFILKNYKINDGEVISHATILNGNPLFESIKLSKEPYLTTDIKDASVLSHYKKTGAIRSDVYMIPYIQDTLLVGVFCFDSSEHGTFSDEITNILNHSVKLFISSDSVGVEQTNKQTTASNKAYENFLRDCFLVKNENQFFQHVKEYVPLLFNASNFYIVKQISDSEAQIVSILGSTEGVSKFDSFLLSDGIVGFALKENQFVSLDKIIQNKEFTIRFTANEKKPERIKSFMFMPFGTDPAVGIGFESEHENHFSNEDKTRLKDLSSDLGLFYEEVLSKEEIVSESIYDQNGFALNFKLFKHIFLQQKTLFLRNQIHFQCFIVRILKTELKNNNYRESIYKYVFNELSNDLRPSDFIFSYNTTTFLVLLSNTDKTNGQTVKKRFSKISGERFLIDNNYVEAEVYIEVIEKCHDKTVDDIKFKLHMSK